MARRTVSQTEEPGKLTSGQHARQIGVDEFRSAVSNFYGTLTLVIDKDFAANILELNTANRRFNRRKLDRLVSQMTDGEYENTGEPIIISAEGILNDGQHRLQAVVESDTMVEMDVWFGIPRRAVAKTDTGSSRTGADILAIRGVAGSTAIAPAIRLLILYRRGLPDSVREFVSNAEVDAAFGKWADIEAAGQHLAGYNFPKGIKSTPLLATAFLASRSPSREKLSAWLETLATGLATGRTDPAYILRERLMRGVDAPVGTREGLVERFALMVLSWNACALGRGFTTKNFRWPPTGKNAQPLPKVDGVHFS